MGQFRGGWPARRGRLGIAVSGVLAAGLLAGSLVSCGPAPIDQLLSVDGERSVLHTVPGAAARPLMLVLHGLGGSGDQMRSLTAMSAFADRHGFSVVYPDAHRAPPVPVPTPPPPPSPTSSPVPVPTDSPTPSQSATPTPATSTLAAPTTPSTGQESAPALLQAVRAADGRMLNEVQAGTAGTTRAWNAGFCCSGAAGDDVAYLRHVVAAATRATRVDLRRVYVVGLSNGGMMATRAICEAPDLFAAAGSVAGPYLGSRCSRPVWLHLHGGNDPVVPYGGGLPPGMPGYGVPADWCHCRFPSSATETARFGPYVAARLYPAGTHTWPTPGSVWRLDGNATLWSMLSLFKH